jgi:tRNA (adenine57-N1/adenine58-N1)-methyltransferase
LLKNANNQNAADIITWPLCPGKEHALSRTKDYQRDSFRHDDIIGKNIRDVVKTRKGVSYRILEPTLAEYTDNSPRMVTPVRLSLLVDEAITYRISVDILSGCQPNCFAT